jgi:hypothetical protein
VYHRTIAVCLNSAKLYRCYLTTLQTQSQCNLVFYDWGGKTRKNSMMTQGNTSSNKQPSRDFPTNCQSWNIEMILPMKPISKHSLSILNSSINKPQLVCRKNLLFTSQGHMRQLNCTHVFFVSICSLPSKWKPQQNQQTKYRLYKL